jgi:hypothetical protein
MSTDEQCCQTHLKIYGASYFQPSKFLTFPNLNYLRTHLDNLLSCAIYCREQKILVVNVISKFG